ncbi:CPBP family intramembrane metalloprotease [Streptomonospora sp. S1-112]|uniref:CPBP family intramembrane metalloprotease n=1 Tax=Streptomonospora mangrovi TaxID=2883123 RepID=A0A9X3NJK7_9ACTN|nr:type II CAAX endopeptidase family protein [Streptomonospora mangrovi]MDA0564220.1 CPBP family intramembrane metalloprotease [Streptomonospora mangrovi]
MSDIRPDHPRRPGAAHTAATGEAVDTTGTTGNAGAAGTAAAAAPVRPGWPETAVGLVAFVVAAAAVVFFGPIGPLDLSPVVHGLVLAAWSGIAGLIGFGAAVAVRRRPLAAFGIRRTTWRWMLAGAVAGIAALLIKGVVTWALVTLTGFSENPQGAYYDAAGGGVAAAVLTILFLSVLTPIGEEFLFRGVLANHLLRYGPLVGVVGSSVIFAVFHGINVVLPAAIVVGVVACEMMRRSGSIWPAVAVHTVNNLALPLLVLFTGVAGPGPMGG